MCLNHIFCNFFSSIWKSKVTEVERTPHQGIFWFRNKNGIWSAIDDFNFILKMNNSNPLRKNLGRRPRFCRKWICLRICGTDINTFKWKINFWIFMKKSFHQLPTMPVHLRKIWKKLDIILQPCRAVWRCDFCKILL